MDEDAKPTDQPCRSRGREGEDTHRDGKKHQAQIPRWAEFRPSIHIDAGKGEGKKKEICTGPAGSCRQKKGSHFSPQSQDKNKRRGGEKSPRRPEAPVGKGKDHKNANHKLALNSEKEKGKGKRQICPLSAKGARKKKKIGLRMKTSNGILEKGEGACHVGQNASFLISHKKKKRKKEEKSDLPLRITGGAGKKRERVCATFLIERGKEKKKGSFSNPQIAGKKEKSRTSQGAVLGSTSPWKEKKKGGGERSSVPSKARPEVGKGGKVWGQISAANPYPKEKGGEKEEALLLGLGRGNARKKEKRPCASSRRERKERIKPEGEQAGVTRRIFAREETRKIAVRAPGKKTRTAKLARASPRGGGKEKKNVPQTSQSRGKSHCMKKREKKKRGGEGQPPVNRGKKKKR